MEDWVEAATGRKVRRSRPASWRMDKWQVRRRKEMKWE